MSPARGLTLIEVLIASAITAIIGALVAGSFARAGGARDLAEAQDQRFTGARLTLTRMARELSQAYLSEHYDRKRFRDRPTLFRGKDRGDEDEVLFTTFAHARLVRDAKESDQAVVEYAVAPDPGWPGERSLWRREKAHIDDDPERGGSRAVVLEHVRGFDVQYWDFKKGEWVREWDTTSADRSAFLPTRVRVRLRLSMPDGKDRTFETQARVAIVRPLQFR